jgi:hypothetical protein
MIAKLVAIAFLGGFGALLTAPSPSVLNDEVAIKCSTRCQVLQGNTINVTNPGGGTMTVTYVGLSPGICGCEVLPCAWLEACAGAIRFAFDWKKRSDAIDQVDINPDLTASLSCPSYAAATNCQ